MIARSPNHIVLAAILSLAVPQPAAAAVFVYTTTLSGSAEAPPNASPGTGTGTVTYDSVARTFRVQTSFSGLTGPVTVAHIHAATAVPGTGTAGVATRTPTFPGFPAGVQAGSYDSIFDMTLATTWNPAYVTANGGTTAGAEAAFATALSQGRAYLNIHTQQFSGGEIRGFLAAVPEPGIWLTMIAGFTIVGGAMRRRRRAVPCAA